MPRSVGNSPRLSLLPFFQSEALSWFCFSSPLRSNIYFKKVFISSLNVRYIADLWEIFVCGTVSRTTLSPHWSVMHYQMTFSDILCVARKDLLTTIKH